MLYKKYNHDTQSQNSGGDDAAQTATATMMELEPATRTGRKPTKDRIYIEKSIKQIEMYKEQLIKLDEEDRVEERKKLYSKMSALQARVKRRREQIWQANTQKNFDTQFNKLVHIIADCLDYADREVICQAMVNKRKKVVQEKIQRSGSQQQVTKKQLVDEFQKFIKKDMKEGKDE